MAISFLLAIILVVLRAYGGRDSAIKPRPLLDALERIFGTAFDAFFDCALYFAFAVELASAVMLVQKDYGLSTRGFGASDAQIALANSVVCVLPLLYYIGIGPHPGHSPLPPARSMGCSSTCTQPETSTGSMGSAPSEQQAQSNTTLSSKKREAKGDASHSRDFNFRLLLFCLVTVLSLYCFYSQVIHNWGSSRIGDQSRVASDHEWQHVVDLCHGNVDPLSAVEERTLAVFELLGGLTVYLFTLWQVVMFRMRQSMSLKGEAVRDAEANNDSSSNPCHGQNLINNRKLLRRILGCWAAANCAAAVIFVIPLVLSLPLLWWMFRLRQIQAEVLKNRGIQYMGNEWAFGQIIGVVIFAPVATQACYAAWRNGLPVRGSGRHGNSPTAGSSSG